MRLCSQDTTFSTTNLHKVILGASCSCFLSTISCCIALNCFQLSHAFLSPALDNSFFASPSPARLLVPIWLQIKSFTISYNVLGRFCSHLVVLRLMVFFVVVKETYWLSIRLFSSTVLTSYVFWLISTCLFKYHSHRPRQRGRDCLYRSRLLHPRSP